MKKQRRIIPIVLMFVALSGAAVAQTLPKVYHSVCLGAVRRHPIPTTTWPG
jgi:hypothetical protein